MAVRTGNVVADVTAHVQRLANGDNPAHKVPQTPAQFAAACGYPGSKASALRQHIARQHGQGAVRTGHGRYPAVTPAQMLVLLGAGHKVRTPTVTAAQRLAAAKQAKAVLWARRSRAAGSGKAKRAAAAKPAPAKRTPAQAFSALSTDAQAQLTAVGIAQGNTAAVADAIAHNPALATHPAVVAARAAAAE